jgi:CBS domain-containing protein
MSAFGTIRSVLEHKGHALWTVAPDSSVFDAIQMMSDNNIGALVVMEADKLVGVVSERDYTRKVALRGKASRQTPVKEIMFSPAISVSPQHSVEECMRIMTDRRVRHLPVLENERVIGIISIGDLVNWIISAQRATIDHLESYISGKYPA